MLKVHHLRKYQFSASGLQFLYRFPDVRVAAGALCAAIPLGWIATNAGHHDSARRLPAAAAPASKAAAAPGVTRSFRKAVKKSAKSSARGVVHMARKVKQRWDHDLFARPEEGMYKRFFRMRVTAYTPINEGMEGGRWTATSRDGRSAHGVAVDPRLIPLGTRLWVPGYGHAIADDTGGMIRGHRLDIRLQDRSGMSRWGVRSLPVYVLSEP